MKSILKSVALAAAAVPANNVVLALSTTRIRRSITPATSSSILFPPTILESSSTVDRETIERSAATNNLSPFLQGMVDEQQELQLNVGKAMDTLRKDYPYFLKRAPDYSIYHDDIALTAKDGETQLSKLSSYKKAFGVMRTVLGLLYDTDKSVIQNRMVYDSTRTQIRVSFNAMLVPKLQGVGRTVHVDGISVYSIDLSSTMREDENGNLERNEGAGKIVEHRIEKLLVNGAALQPPYFNAFGQLEMLAGQQGQLAGAGVWG